MSLLFGCDLPLSGCSGSLEARVSLVAAFGCKFSHDVELSGLRLRYEVVCLVSFVAHCCSVLSLPPIKDGLRQFGDGCECRNDTNN